MTSPRSVVHLAALLVTAVLAATALVTTAAPSGAAGPQPAYRYAGAALLVCKTTLPGGDRIRIRARLDNRGNPAPEARSGRVAVTQRGEDRGDVGFPLMRGGRISVVKAFSVPAGRRLRVTLAISASQYGNGTSIRLARVRPC